MLSSLKSYVSLFLGTSCKGEGNLLLISVRQDWWGRWGTCKGIRSSFKSSRLGIIAYIVPFLFVFFPALLLRGSVEEIIITFITAVFGCYALSAALGGYIFRALNPIKRIIFMITGIGLLIPIQSHLLAFGVAVNIGCGGLALLLIIWEWYGGRRK